MAEGSGADRGCSRLCFALVVGGNECCFAAEVGLSGEIRSVNRIEQRIAEAEKLGYKQIIISKFNKFNSKLFKIEIKKCAKIEEVFQLLF